MPADPTHPLANPASRRQRVARMLRQPDAWQVCCGCDSVVSAQRAICPYCAAYRFLTFAATPDTVRKAIQKLEKKTTEPLPESGC